MLFIIQQKIFSNLSTSFVSFALYFWYFESFRNQRF